MLYKRMEYFVSIVKRNSFTEAAEDNYISQSAISQQMRALEDDLGVLLFERKNRSFELTDAGKYFYQQSLSILSDVDIVKKEIVELSGGSDKFFRIGYLRSLDPDDVGSAVAIFAEKHGDIEVELAKGNHEELYVGLKTGTYDLVVNDQRRAFSDAYVNYEVTSLKLYAGINRNSHLADQSYLTPDDVKKLPCILISSREQQNEEQEFYGEALGIGTHYIFAESMEEARLLVSGNRGFLLSEKNDLMGKSNKQIVEIPMYRYDKPIERKLCIFWKKSGDRVIYREFADIMKEIFKAADK